MSVASYEYDGRGYEIWERRALDTLECPDCNVSLAKDSPGKYFCPSCGMECEE
jgi:predicted RNA-binding Zn-ribbon protein involved in translation (DUF1610 family)